VRAIEKSRNEESLKEDFKYLKPILQMRTRPNFINQILVNYLLLWFRPNEKRSFARKASCGATLLTAKLVSHHRLVSLSQKQSFLNVVLPQTVADDFSIYQI